MLLIKKFHIIDCDYQINIDHYVNKKYRENMRSTCRYQYLSTGTWPFLCT